MSQAKITKEDVRKAVEQLEQEGHEATVDNIRARLGNVGSRSTILRFKRELVAEVLAAKDNPEMVKSYRAMYQTALQEGKALMQSDLEELEQALDDSAAESERSALEVAALRLRAEEAAKGHDETVAKLNRAIDDLAKTRQASERYAAKLVDIGEVHAQEVKKLRDQAEVARTEHDRELRQLRDQAGKENEQHRQECVGLRQQLTTLGAEHRLEIERLRDQAEKANDQHRGEIDELRARLDAEKERTSDLQVKLAREEARAEARYETKTSEEPAELPVPTGRRGPT